MTPKEISGRMKAFHKNARHESEKIDVLAWMTGLYVARGYHDPEHYPTKPDFIKAEYKEPVEMEEETIKDVLTTFAEIHNAIKGVET